MWVRLSRLTGEEEPPLRQLTRKEEAISVSVVAVIGYGQKFGLAFLPRNWTGNDLTAAFERDIYPNLQWSNNQRRPTELIWDNDGRHFTKIWREFVARRRIQVIEHWPSNSPDLNPIENVWSEMKEHVEKVQPSNEAELREAIRTAWEDLDLDHTRHLMNSMSARLAQVIQRKGARCDY